MRHHFALPCPRLLAAAILWLLCILTYKTACAPLSLDSSAASPRLHRRDVIPSYETIKQHYVEDKSKATVFYSGLGPNSKKRLVELAKDPKVRGRICEESFRKDAAFPGLFCDKRPGMSDDQYKKFCIRFSKVLAERASGTAYVVLKGGKADPKSIWTEHELPALQKNGRVTSIVQIDFDSGKKSPIWPKAKLRRREPEQVEERQQEQQQQQLEGLSSLLARREPGRAVGRSTPPKGAAPGKAAAEKARALCVKVPLRRVKLD
ncbi:hypothetical protein DFJ73DRAFT_784707 [Zopfochytrium polystomum]|nr:hypothetical protein DFJ73DRAFT_784707 [Zopfochytrium polystomum]